MAGRGLNETCFKVRSYTKGRLARNDVHHTRAFDEKHKRPKYILPPEFHDPRGNDYLVNERHGKERVTWKDIDKAYKQKNPYGRKHKRIHHRARLYREALVVCNEHTGRGEMTRLMQDLEDGLGITVIDCHIHRDEGKVNKKTGKLKTRNWHLHLRVSNLNIETGETIDLNKRAMRDAQDICAKALNMKRGRKYKPGEATPRGRSHQEYRALMKWQEAQEEKVAAALAERDQATTKLEDLQQQIAESAIHVQPAPEPEKRTDGSPDIDHDPTARVPTPEEQQAAQQQLKDLVAREARKRQPRGKLAERRLDDANIVVTSRYNPERRSPEVSELMRIAKGEPAPARSPATPPAPPEDGRRAGQADATADAVDIHQLQSDLAAAQERAAAEQDVQNARADQARAKSSREMERLTGELSGETRGRLIAINKGLAPDDEKLVTQEHYKTLKEIIHHQDMNLEQKRAAAEDLVAPLEEQAQARRETQVNGLKHQVQSLGAGRQRWEILKDLGEAWRDEEARWDRVIKWRGSHMEGLRAVLELIDWMFGTRSAPDLEDDEALPALREELKHAVATNETKLSDIFGRAINEAEKLGRERLQQEIDDRAGGAAATGPARRIPESDITD